MFKKEKNERVYRKISQAELEEILSEHMEWLLSEESQGRRAWLVNTDLEGVNWERILLKKADLKGANLKGANLKGANLKSAHLGWGNLKGANLEGANLKGAYLRGANLKKANLRDSNLREARLHGVALTGANLQDSNLREADLRMANLTGANLRMANLKRAWLMAANLNGAYLGGASLNRALLTEANLTGVNLNRAELKDADLSRADLKGAKLKGAHFDNANTNSVKYDRWAKYKGIRVDNCFGNAIFKRFAQDQDFIEEFRSRKFRFPFYLIWLIFADCGRSWLLWSGWTIIFALSFAFLYTPYPDGYPDHLLKYIPNPIGQYINDLDIQFEQGASEFKEKEMDFVAALYFSIVTFTTLGFGDIIANSENARILVTLEVILGYIMLGGLISIMASKLARRS